MAAVRLTAEGPQDRHYRRSVQILRCPRCRQAVPIQSLSCAACGVDLGFHPAELAMVEVSPDGVAIDAQPWITCANRGWECNWLLPTDAEAARCFSCRLTRNRPASDDTIALEKLVEASRSKRRLLIQLAQLGLPVDPYYEHEGGLAFDLLSSYSGAGPVTTGHASGVITIDLVETLDDYRERLRVRLGEPYRTMLGHFRHEVAHYYQWILVEQGPLIDECRELFGDERASYSEALDRHYRLGAPDGWEEAYISEYATMHPWEDFAETFAHYLHITDTLTTAATGGMVLSAARLDGLIDHDIVPRASYLDHGIEDVIADWRWLSLFFNAVNHAMGKDDLYPFRLVEPAVRKLGFVHEVVRQTERTVKRPILV